MTPNPSFLAMRNRIGRYLLTGSSYNIGSEVSDIKKNDGYIGNTYLLLAPKNNREIGTGTTGVYFFAYI